MHCHTTWGQWAVELLQCTTTLPGGGGQCNSCNALPHYLGAVGSGNSAVPCLTAWGQWAVQLPQCTHYLTAWGQWAVALLQCTAPLPGGSGQWNSFVVWCGVVWCGVVWSGVVCQRRCYHMVMAGMSCLRE